jgi:hypothetical protein
MRKPKRLNQDELLKKWQSLKEAFQSEHFQWIMPPAGQESSGGKVVKCIDIEHVGNGRFVAMFDDKSQIDTRKINEAMMMMAPGVEPLSQIEVASIMQGGGTNESMLDKDKMAQEVKNNLGAEAAQEYLNEANKAKSNPNVAAAAATPNQVIQPQPTITAENIFGSFSTEDTNIALKMSIQLPKKNLLKMMYQNASDKDEFIENLSLYVLGQINKDVINDSLIGMLDPKRKKTSATAKPEVSLEEVKDEEKD